MTQDIPLGFQECVIHKLRALYNRYGYFQYRMSKFEEYDLYARNKDFLISDGVITFMDTNGMLMALKPDVTLSIIKNTRDHSPSLQKVYYNENVYRAAKGTNSFREIMQVGLECVGAIDDYCICEVLTLAAKSLVSISEDFILEVSHLGFLSDLIDVLGIPAAKKRDLLRLIGEKNIHEVCALCADCGITGDRIDILKQILSVSGKPTDILPSIIALLSEIINTHPLKQLLRVTEAIDAGMNAERIRFDFSVVGNVRYYNGVVFKGFISGVPSSVLSGGQYDNLMQKMGRSDGAIGFAIYMDTLERLDKSESEYDADTILLYDDNAELSVITFQVERLSANGASVVVLRQRPNGIRYRRVLKLKGSEVEILEDNA